jgi:parallel beta-helix repeat protein
MLRKSEPLVRLLAYALFFLLGAATAQAATYYVATTGNDSNPGSIQQPFRTIGRGISVLKPGDTTFIRAGTYPEIINTNVFNLPSGISWSSAITIAAYPGEIVTMRPDSGEAIVNLGLDYQYIIFDGIHFDAINGYFTAISITGSHHIRFKNCEITNAYRSGVYINWGGNGLPSNYNEFINCDIHHNGRHGYQPGVPDQPPGYGAGHGIYITTQYNVLRGNRVHHNGNWGIHVYWGEYPAQQTKSNLIEQNWVYENGNNTTRYGGVCCGGIVVASGSTNEIKNNLVYKNPVVGIVVMGSCGSCRLYNNTVYNNSLDIQADTGGSGEIQNNIAFPKGVSIAGGYTASNNLTSNPNFVDAVSNDFRLLSSSAAIDAGMTLNAVPIDFARNPRPQGSAHDIGAYEFGGGTNSAPAPPRNLSVR